MKTVALALATLALGGCAALPTGARVELEHVSHPLAGWPCEKQAGSEDGVSQASALLEWHAAHAYAEAGIGYNLEGRNGGGMYGPALMGTVRVGYHWDFHK